MTLPRTSPRRRGSARSSLRIASSFGRLDVLVNNGGVGFGATAGEHETKSIDLQLDVNLRAIVLMYREALGMLRFAGLEHGCAQVVNIASIAGKQPGAWLSVYSAAKAGVIAYTQAMNRELDEDGIRSVALCPGWVAYEHDRLDQGSRCRRRR